MPVHGLGRRMCLSMGRQAAGVRNAEAQDRQPVVWERKKDKPKPTPLARDWNDCNHRWGVSQLQLNFGSCLK
jgi:hypothetical protein